MKKIIKFIKRNVFSCTCFLLAIAVCLTDTFSYARYISVDSYDRSTGAGSFSCSANIDGVSALSFTNTAFWGGTTSEDKIAMNALRAIEFKVNNFEGTGSDKKVSEVKMNYQLIFSAPKNFIEKLAIQLFDDTSTAILPQIVLQDLVKSSGTYNTASSEDFNGSPATDLTFTVTKSGNDFTATAGDIKIEIDEVNIEIEQALQYRVWDVSALTNETNKVANTEGGKLLPPLEVKFTSEVTCYRIKISMPQFKFDAGTEQTRDYSLRLVPTATLEDDHLGGYLMDGTEKPTTIYAGQTLGVQTIKEKHTNYTDNTFSTPIAGSESTVNVHGNPKVYTKGNTVTDQPIEYQYTVVGEPVVTKNNGSTTSTEKEDDVEYGVWSTQSRFQRTRTRSMTQTKTVTTTIIGDEEETVVQITTNNSDEVTVSTTVLDVYEEDGNDAFELQISETTKSTIYQTTTTTSTNASKRVYVHTESRTGTQTQTKTNNSSWDGNGTITTSDSWNGWVSNNDEEEVVSQRVESETKIDTDSEDVSPADPTVKNFFRKIIRTYENIDITLTSVKRQVQVGTELETVEYTSNTNAFDLFEGDTIQNYYLSQSYSKNYPLKVNVIFEQTQ